EVEIREKVIDVEARASRHRDGAVGAVEQFANITGPMISLRRRKGLRHEGVRRSAEAIGRGTCSRVEERNNVLSTIAQRRQHASHDIDPVPKVLSEAALEHHFLKIA